MLENVMNNALPYLQCVGIQEVGTKVWEMFFLINYRHIHATGITIVKYRVFQIRLF